MKGAGRLFFSLLPIEAPRSECLLESDFS